MQNIAVALLGLWVLAAFGCRAVGQMSDGRRWARETAARGGWQEMRFDAGRFIITGYGTAVRGPKLKIYLEGDGRAFVHRAVPSRDPTPDRPLALELAVIDPFPSILYLGRPCQFTTAATRKDCRTADWTANRYSEAVITAMGRAIDQAKERYRAEKIQLTGYSGGGVIAVLLAARRQDVEAVMTIASPLDHLAWTRHHGVSPLTGSLNPADTAAKTARIPQIHLAGERDSVVPSWIIDRYRQRLPANAPVQVVTVSGPDHHTGWLQIWPALLDRYRRPGW